ncbi:MAG TPA: CBS domain-containing protein [Rubricoccaceae bacterium]|nr:CBS domain-containing protein [Rubricoccaceae bacterium]
MEVREIMTRGVETVPPHATLQEAAQKMKDLDVGSVPVSDGERLSGMITDRDITIRATAAGLDAGTTRVSDIMTPEVVTCREDASVEDVARLMEEHQIRRLPIVDAEDRLVGIVALGDLAVEAGNDRRTGDVLESVSQPAR